MWRASARSVFATPLVPAHRSSLSRLGEMHAPADALELVGHDPPTGRRLQPDLELLLADRSQNRLTPARRTGQIRERITSPFSVSVHSAVICARRWSSPITIVISNAPRSHRLRGHGHARTKEASRGPGRPSQATYQVTPAILDSGGRHGRSRSDQEDRQAKRESARRPSESQTDEPDDTDRGGTRFSRRRS
jgi:hypothetical protein